MAFAPKIQRLRFLVSMVLNVFMNVIREFIVIMIRFNIHENISNVHSKSDERNSDTLYTEKVLLSARFPPLKLNVNYMFRMFKIHMKDIRATHSI